jgi:hypothetical protein
LMIAILTGMRRTLVWFWFAFPLWPGMLSISSRGFGHLDFFLWKSSVQLICHFFIGSLIFLAPYTFWLLIPQLKRY